jgi:tetraacyldisaccharide-1-P 4'-kinase
VRLIQGGTAIEPATVGPVFAVAAIARPQRFFDDLTAAGWRLNGTLTFPDHHRFTQADVNRVLAAVRAAQTHVVVTTAKDLVRLEPLDCRAFALAVAAVRATVQPDDTFREWLLDGSPGHERVLSPAPKRDRPRRSVSVRHRLEVRSYAVRSSPFD